MRLFDVIAAGAAIGLVGKIITSLQEEAKWREEEMEKEKQRRSTPCQFSKTVSQKDFEQIVMQSVKKIKRDITIQEQMFLVSEKSGVLYTYPRPSEPNSFLRNSAFSAIDFPF